MTAVIIAGRVGASFTAELGTMKVSEEIMALETSAINPVRYLVSPRLVAMVVMVPCLAVLSDAVGMFGGFVIGKFKLGLQTAYYLDKSLAALAVERYCHRADQERIFCRDHRHDRVLLRIHRGGRRRRCGPVHYTQRGERPDRRGRGGTVSLPPFSTSCSCDGPGTAGKRSKL